jgi:hypothetical protein
MLCARVLLTRRCPCGRLCQNLVNRISAPCTQWCCACVLLRLARSKPASLIGADPTLSHPVPIVTPCCAPTHPHSILGIGRAAVDIPIRRLFVYHFLAADTPLSSPLTSASGLVNFLQSQKHIEVACGVPGEEWEWGGCGREVLRMCPLRALPPSRRLYPLRFARGGRCFPRLVPQVSLAYEQETPQAAPSGEWRLLLPRDLFSLCASVLARVRPRVFTQRVFWGMVCACARVCLAERASAGVAGRGPGSSRPASAVSSTGRVPLSSQSAAPSGVAHAGSDAGSGGTTSSILVARGC